MDSPTLWPCLFLLGSHEYALAWSVLEGSVVQNSNHVSVFELSPPLFDIGSDVATHEASWVAVLSHRTHRCSSLVLGLRVSLSGPQAHDMPF